MCNFMNEYNLTIVNFNLLTNNLVQFIIYNIFIQYNNFFKVCSIFIKLCSSRLLPSPYNICKFRAQAKWKLLCIVLFSNRFHSVCWNLSIMDVVALKKICKRPGYRYGHRHKNFVSHKNLEFVHNNTVYKMYAISKTA
jgi:hypothetical protein